MLQASRNKKKLNTSFFLFSHFSMFKQVYDQISRTSSYGHTTVKAPYPIRTAKLSTVGPDQYYGRGLRGNLRCCMSFFILTCKKKFAKEKKPISTTDSHVVPYRSTDVAQWCLTSQFRWDTVLSPWYDRQTRSLRWSATPPGGHADHSGGLTGLEVGVSTPDKPGRCFRRPRGPPTLWRIPLYT